MSSLAFYETENTISVSQNKVFDGQDLVVIFKAVIDGASQLVVNARDLHEYLKVKRKFAGWISNRIKEYDFTVNLDFIGFTQNGVKPTGGRPTIEYHLSLDMAKELAMVEKTTEGRNVRRYFIQCEKMLHRSDSEQRTSLRQACERLASGNMLVSDAYKYVGSHFGYPDGIVDIPVSLLPEAVVLAYEMILSRQKPVKTMNDASDKTNSHALSVHMMHCKHWFDSVRAPLEVLNPVITRDIGGHFEEGLSAAKLLNRALCNM